MYLAQVGIPRHPDNDLRTYSGSKTPGVTPKQRTLYCILRTQRVDSNRPLGCARVCRAGARARGAFPAAQEAQAEQHP